MRLLSLGVFLLATFSAAVVGSQFTPGEWYASIARPSWTPPSWIFGPVWTALYTMMAVAGWLVWIDRGWARGRLAIGLFAAQLTLNALWSYLFFGARQPGTAAVEIVILWVTIAVTTVVFWRIRRAAGLLFAPYLAWVTFAMALNIEIWRLNR
jgi:translocator protein